MKIIPGLKNFKAIPEGCVATLGVLDGVHIGHQRIIRQLVASAKRTGSESLVITFDPHPLKLTTEVSNFPLLISLRHRLRLIEQLGVNNCLILKFTRELSQMSPEEFTKSILYEKFKLKQLFVGENFRFGRDAQGDVSLLKSLGAKFGLKVKVIGLERADQQIASSTRIRTLIEKGDLNAASRLLGRPYSILGKVVKGSGRGKGLGYPTANISFSRVCLPPRGVYVARVAFRDITLAGVANLGVRPTFGDTRTTSPKLLEVYLFDFKGHLYGKELEVFFLERIRDERQFKDPRRLAKRIREDEIAARSRLWKMS